MLTIMFYDEGIGIPKSLPRTYPEIFRSLGGLLNDDAQLIQAATKIKRSSTNKKNRGRGLKDIKDYVKSVNNGMLKILSQRGELFSCHIMNVFFDGCYQFFNYS